MEFSFYYNERIIKIICGKESKIKEIFDIFEEGIGKRLNLYYLYEGNQINKELTFNQQFKELKTKHKNILAFERDNIIMLK